MRRSCHATKRLSADSNRRMSRDMAQKHPKCKICGVEHRLGECTGGSGPGGAAALHPSLQRASSLPAPIMTVSEPSMVAVLKARVAELEAENAELRETAADLERRKAADRDRQARRRAAKP